MSMYPLYNYKYLLPPAGNVTRVSFLNVDHFAHLNKDQGGVKQEFDVALKRCVISVKSQRTPLHMVHVFSNVMPGRYVVQFRIRLPDSRLAFLYRNSNGDSPTPVQIIGNYTNVSLHTVFSELFT